MDGTATKIIISIVNHGDAEHLVEVTKQAGARGGTILHGRGTAKQQWLQLLGLGDSHKEIVFTITQQSILPTIFEALKQDTHLHKTNGIAIVLSISMLIRRSLSAQPYVVREKGEDMSASTHELISVIVNSGYADDVMAAARKVGAKGGTIINARGTGKEEDVLRLNEAARFRYRAMKMRVVDFGEDNEPVKFQPHKGGEQ